MSVSHGELCVNARWGMAHGLRILSRLWLGSFHAFLCCFPYFFTAELFSEPHKSKAGAGIQSVCQHQNCGGWCVRCWNLFSGNAHFLVSFLFYFLYWEERVTFWLKGSLHPFRTILWVCLHVLVGKGLSVWRCAEVGAASWWALELGSADRAAHRSAGWRHAEFPYTSNLFDSCSCTAIWEVKSMALTCAPKQYWSVKPVVLSGITDSCLNPSHLFPLVMCVFRAVQCTTEACWVLTPLCCF